MIVSLTPLMWSLVQVSLLATVALFIAAILRGRFPQWTSAMLAGSGVASLVLVAMAWVPAWQWSLASLSVNNNLQSTNANSPSDVDSPQDSDSSPNAEASSNIPSTSNNDAESSETTNTRSETIQHWMSLAASWASNQLQQVDDRVRNFESTPSEARSAFVVAQSVLGTLIVFLVGFWVYCWIWTRALVRHGQTTADAKLLERTQQHALRMNLKHIPRVLLSSKVTIGATVGYRRKTILLSPNWNQWSDAELDAVLLHELAHVVRNDYAWVLLSSWIRTLFFFHPLMHLLVRRWRMEQELAADQLAARWMHSARAYGRALASLALRTQSEAKMPSPVLTAEQVCIVRRVTMLKQGSLKPASYRWRWTAMLTALTVVSLMPLSGLRGTQTQQLDETAVATEQVQSDDGSPSLSEEDRERMMEFQRTQEVYPPVQFEGRLKWNPGKLLTKDVSPSARYLQELATFALIEQFPEKAEIQCPATTALRWTDMAREHGRVDIGAKCNESQGLNPKLITRLITSPLLGNYSLSSHVKTIEGLQARGLVSKKWDAKFEKLAYETQPSSWLVEDGESYFYGSEAEVAKQIRNRHGKTEESPLIVVPDELKQQYDKSAGALVYSNCAEWKQQLRKHMDGSPKAYEFAMVYPFLDNLKYIGIFVTGDNGLTIEANVGYKSAEAATRGAKLIKGLIDMAKAQLTRAEDREFLQLLNETQVTTTLDSVRVELCNPALAELACKHLLPQKYEGWTDILALVTPHKDPGTVQFDCDHPFATTGFLAQSVKGEQYHGKRVRVSAELGATNSILERSGVILWASDSENNSLDNATSGKSIGKLIDPAQALEELKRKPSDEELRWQTAVVELDVPSKTDVFSFGVYTAAGRVLVRNVKFEVIGEARISDSDPSLSLTALPRNLIHIPNAGYVCEQPTNLDFSRKTPDFPSTEAASARTAEIEVNRTDR